MERFETSLGLLGIEATDAGIRRISFFPKGPMGGGRDQRINALLADIESYARGDPVDLSRHPTDLSQATDFQRRVWRAASSIPYGETASYGELARAIGCPGAARAVGNALGANPTPLIIPCHRIVAKGGAGGFSVGLPMKLKLLGLEGSTI